MVLPQHGVAIAVDSSDSCAGGVIVMKVYRPFKEPDREQASIYGRIFVHYVLGLFIEGLTAMAAVSILEPDVLFSYLPAPVG